jgi:hypothetical protein
MNSGSVIGLGTVSLVVGGLCAVVLWPVLGRPSDPVVSQIMSEWDATHHPDVAERQPRPDPPQPTRVSQSDPSTLRMLSRPRMEYHHRYHKQRYFLRSASGPESETRRLNLEQVR